jgi:DNA-binding CsgD family transcriptional regulator
MSEPKSTGMDRQEKLVRLLAIQVRRGSASQAEAAVEMSKAGFGPTRIADLLGTTANTVNQALNDAKRKAKKGGSGGKAHANSA